METNQTHMELAVAGLHLTGEPLNHQLTSLEAIFVKSCKTTAQYKMYLIEDSKGKKPGLARVPHGERGSQFDLEIWKVPMQNVGPFISNIPQPLGIGTLNLENGTTVKGFICEPWVVEECKDISTFSGWRDFLKSL